MYTFIKAYTPQFFDNAEPTQTGSTLREEGAGWREYYPNGARRDVVFFIEKINWLLLNGYIEKTNPDKMTKQINLKESSWCVKNDGSQLFKENVIKYLNEIHNNCLDGSEIDTYYGFTGSCCDIHTAPFGTVLELSEFIELAKGESEIPQCCNSSVQGGALSPDCCHNYKTTTDKSEPVREELTPDLADRIWQSMQQKAHNNRVSKDAVLHNLKQLKAQMGKIKRYKVASEIEWHMAVQWCMDAVDKKIEKVNKI